MGQVCPLYGIKPYILHPHGNPPIIDEELFDQVQAMIGSKNQPPQQSKHSLAYTGLLKSARCGCLITAEIRKSRYIYYHCTYGKGR